VSATPDILQQILQGPPLQATAFPDSSRYHGIAALQIDGPDKTPIVYLARRFLPRPDRFALLTLHSFREGERLDNITARYLGDPLQFWRICDANGVMSPSELTEKVGTVIRITLPEGVPGRTNA
jgi:hypothetical protein